MLSTPLVTFFKQHHWWYEETTERDKACLTALGIDLESDLASFFLHVEDGPTFMTRGKELHHIGWFMLNTHDYAHNRDVIRNIVTLPSDYLALDSFEGEYGYFYNRTSGEILEMGLGEDIKRFAAGTLTPQWKNTNDFLEALFLS